MRPFANREPGPRWEVVYHSSDWKVWPWVDWIDYSRGGWEVVVTSARWSLFVGPMEIRRLK